jgi:hypothetical protein
MATKRQIAANRRNAQLSTGPTSVTGKAASCMNALKSGIDAQSEIIRDEKTAALDALKKEYYDHHNPTTPAERDLVDILVRSSWSLRRLARIEAEMFEYQMHEMDDLAYLNADTAAAQAFDRNPRLFERLQRHINATQRNFRNALKDLLFLQSLAPAPRPVPPSQTIQTTSQQLAPFPQISVAPALPPANPPIQPQFPTETA